MNYTFHGPLKDAFEYADYLSTVTQTRMRLSRRKIGGVFLTDLDGTPIWDIVRTN